MCKDTRRPLFVPNSGVPALIAGHVILELYMAFLSPLMPYLIEKFKLSLTLAGLLATILTVCGSLPQPLIGFWIDRSPGARFVFWGPLAVIVASSLLGAVPSYVGLLALLGIAGLASAAFHPEGTAAVYGAAQHRRGFATSLFLSAGTVGWALGPLFILSVVGRFGLERSYLAVFPGLAVAAWIRLAAPRGIGRRDVSGGRLRMPPSLARMPAGKTRPLAALWMVVVLKSAVAQGLAAFLPVYWTENGMAAIMTGVWLLVMATGGVLGGIAGGILSDRRGPRLVLVACLGAAAPILLVFFSTVGFVSWAALMVAWFILAAVNPVTLVAAQAIAGSGTAMVAGLMMGFGWAVGGLFVTAVGAVADQIGVGPALRGLSCLLVVAAALALRSGLKAEPAVPVGGRA